MSFLKLPKLKRDVALENESCIDINNTHIGVEMCEPTCIKCFRNIIFT